MSEEKKSTSSTLTLESLRRAKQIMEEMVPRFIDFECKNCGSLNSVSEDYASAHFRKYYDGIYLTCTRCIIGEG